MRRAGDDAQTHERTRNIHHGLERHTQIRTRELTLNLDRSGILLRSVNLPDLDELHLVRGLACALLLSDRPLLEINQDSLPLRLLLAVAGLIHNLTSRILEDDAPPFVG